MIRTKVVSEVLKGVLEPDELIQSMKIEVQRPLFTPGFAFPRLEVATYD